MTLQNKDRQDTTALSQRVLIVAVLKILAYQTFAHSAKVAIDTVSAIFQCISQNPTSVGAGRPTSTAGASASVAGLAILAALVWRRTLPFLRAFGSAPAGTPWVQPTVIGGIRCACGTGSLGRNWHMLEKAAAPGAGVFCTSIPVQHKCQMLQLLYLWIDSGCSATSLPPGYCTRSEICKTPTLEGLAHAACE